MQKIVAWEFRSNNSSSRYVAKLACGHERTDLNERHGGATWLEPRTALCWVCERTPTRVCRGGGEDEADWNCPSCGMLKECCDCDPRCSECERFPCICEEGD